jgi:hypothetical protein
MWPFDRAAPAPAAHNAIVVDERVVDLPVAIFPPAELSAKRAISNALRPLGKRRQECFAIFGKTRTRHKYLRLALTLNCS